MSQEKNTPTFTSITIVGVGLIGGSLALALRRAGYRGTILGVSRPASLEAAQRLGAIDEGFPYERITEAASRSGLVVLSGPILTILEHLRILGAAAGKLQPGTVISDVGSTKNEIIKTATAVLPQEVLFIGGHPLAGSEQRGVAASDPFLFQNAYYVLTPAPAVPPAEVDRLADFISTTGARVVVLPADQHDRVAAAISHLPQILAVNLVNFLGDLGAQREVGIHLAAGGFRDMTRIASSSFAVWKDILSTNRREVLDALDKFVERLRQETAGLDESTLETSFAKAAKTRAEIPRDTKGFLSQLWDILVEVEDKPGTITKLAEPLTAKGLNIKDIEVLKVREGEGGTMRLAFETQKQALQAIEELKRQGFRARARE